MGGRFRQKIQVLQPRIFGRFQQITCGKLFFCARRAETGDLKGASEWPLQRGALGIFHAHAGRSRLSTTRADTPPGNGNSRPKSLESILTRGSETRSGGAVSICLNKKAHFRLRIRGSETAGNAGVQAHPMKRIFFQRARRRDPPFKALETAETEKGIALQARTGNMDHR